MNISYHKKANDNANSKTCEMIIEPKNANAAQIDIIRRYGVIKHFFPMINSYVVEIPKCFVEELSGMPNIASVHENTHVTAQMNNGKKAVKADKMGQRGYNGAGVTIAFLDTGISPVEDFNFPNKRIIAFIDFVNGHTNAYDDNGHGTQIGRFMPYYRG